MAPPDGRERTNRLIHQKSPYLLQHATNPVHWHPWGPEAFERARAEDKPVFLSVGYSTCHWCHVMARESFEDEQVAAILNAHFVAIKVDREERPDIDQIYMDATQMLGNQGGWPNSLWLTGDGRPWFAGTYFPREDTVGRIGFKTLLGRLAGAWRTRRADIEQQATQIAEGLRRMADHSGLAGATDIRGKAGVEGLVSALAEQLRQTADRRFGGFGSRPKFPPHGSLRFLLRQYRSHGDGELLALATATLDAMAAGGIHDHLGGGFHRYSTDAAWFLPHFEKMLYDNAQLGRTYVEAAELTGQVRYRRVAEGLFDWVLREMTDPAGGFYSAFDADSEGQEGKFYLWTRAEIVETLGADEGELFCRAYGVTEEGNYCQEATGHRPGTNILYLPEPVDEVAKAEGGTAEALDRRLAAARGKLLPRRDKRIRPHLDEKVLTGWNGLMIGALAYGGDRLDRPDYIAAADRAATFALQTRRRVGRLRRTYRRGKAALNAYLDDYAFLAEGLLELHAATGEGRWLTEARGLADAMIERYDDDRHGGFFFTSDDHEELLARTKSPFDRAIPAGNGVAVGVLVRLAALTGQDRYADLARGAIEAFWPIMQRAPRGTERLILAADVFSETLGAPSSTPAYAVTAEVIPPAGPLMAGSTMELEIRLEIADGYHINSAQTADGAMASTTVVLAPGSPGNLGQVNYPPGKELQVEFADGPVRVYQGDISLTAQVAIAADAPAGRCKVVFHIDVQACDASRCLQPVELEAAADIDVIARPATAPSPASARDRPADPNP